MKFILRLTYDWPKGGYCRHEVCIAQPITLPEEETHTLGVVHQLDVTLVIWVPTLAGAVGLTERMCSVVLAGDFPLNFPCTI